MRTTAVLLASLFCSLAWGQKDKTVFLKWKLQPNEVITYKTIMEDVDSAYIGASAIEFSKTGSHSAADSVKRKAKGFLPNAEDYYKGYDFITTLTEKKKGIINVDMMMRKKENKGLQNKDTSGMDPGMGKAEDELDNTALLRGVITVNGEIKSFYASQYEKRLLATFFELPGKAIKIGDQWALDANFIFMDAHFMCDSSYHRNIVTLTDIKKVNNETIAVIKYDLIEYLSGTNDITEHIFGPGYGSTMQVGYQGMAEFSVDRGRWKSYQCIMTVVGSGLLLNEEIKKYKLMQQ